MGYYSRLAATLIEREYFHGSYPTEREKIVWRIDDLNCRLQELLDNVKCPFSAISDSGDRINTKEINFVQPEHLDSVSGLLLALDRAQMRLDEIDGHIVSVAAIVPGQMILTELYKTQRQSVEW